MPGRGGGYEWSFHHGGQKQVIIHGADGTRREKLTSLVKEGWRLSAGVVETSRGEGSKQLFQVLRYAAGSSTRRVRL